VLLIRFKEFPGLKMHPTHREKH